MTRVSGWSRCKPNIQLMIFLELIVQNMIHVLRKRHQFRKGIRWKVGDGTRIHFWLDNWCANDDLVTLLAISDISQINTSLMVSQFITDAKAWDVMKLKELVDDVHTCS